ncbi:MAG TPA: RnfABCDGE type electron transport complex subunit D [Chloroflexota bacterium]|nr:RnfABCDGE type electron transport complex subunit D [Chloroflexota bacterium]
MNLKAYFRTPKGMLVVALAALTGIAYTVDGPAAVLRVSLAAGAAVVVDLLFKAIKGKVELPDSALLTGFIVGMILSPQVPIGVAILASAVAVTSKHLIAGKHGHFLNPAAFGLLVVGVLMSTEQSWWGGLGDLPAVAIAAVVLAGWFIAERVNKMPTVLAFLGTYLGLMTVAAVAGSGQVFGDAFREPMTGAAVFFACFMLTDPPTSPARASDQVWFAVIAALVSVACLAVNVGGVYYLLIGLLAANVFEGGRRALASRKKTKPARAPRAGGLGSMPRATSPAA